MDESLHKPTLVEYTNAMLYEYTSEYNYAYHNRCEKTRASIEYLRELQERIKLLRAALRIFRELNYI